MSKIFDSNERETEKLLKNLESRIARLESFLKLEPIPHTKDKTVTPDISEDKSSTRSDLLELQIGQYWFAKAGIIVLALGVIFLMTFPYENLPSFVPSLIGYFLTGLILLFVYFLTKSYAYITKYLLAGSLALLYFSTMRFNYFSLDPVITSKAIETILLSIVVAINLFVAVKKESNYLAGIGITTGYITVVLSDNPYLVFLFLSILSGLIVILKLKYEWKSLLIYGIVSTFLIHFIWFINNPFLGNKIILVDEPQANLYFILLYIVVFSCANLFRISKESESNFVRASSFLIAAGGFGLYFLISLLKFQSNLVLLHLILSVVLLGIGITYWLREQSRYSTFFYVIGGYTSLSVAIVAQFHAPDFFIWLCWQSLIVIITSIWFRSKFIIVANFFIYLGLFIVYLVLAGEIGTFTLSYGVVALVSARMLNWRKEKLNLKTELMRNGYLGVAFVIFPYALYNILPSGYVAISWLVVALIYYTLSVVLKNNKYRWMALFTIILTVLYVLLIGTTQLEPFFRIISFLVVGIILIIVSIIYAKRKTKSE